MSGLPSFSSVVETFFDWTNRVQSYLSHMWREHPNRRTTLFLILFGLSALVSYLFFIRPPDAFPLDQLVEVRDGASVQEIALSLKEQRVVRSPLLFKALIMLWGTDRSVRAGDYLFKEPRDVFSVARAMSVGAFGLEPIRIRIPEGAMVKDMATTFDKRLLRFDPEVFKETAQPLEGYLFPDTYFFLPNASEKSIIEAMRQNFETHIEPLRADMEAFGKPLSDIVIMASIIEREARNPEDRRKISSVLWNRIRKDMALQVDVTFLYTIGKGTFQLTLKDLASDSPYNTYKHKGLPPTPIGSPSLDALDAAIHPAKTDFLFFLADHSGVTHFCKTYSCHQANKRRYY